MVFMDSRRSTDGSTRSLHFDPSVHRKNDEKRPKRKVIQNACSEAFRPRTGTTEDTAEVSMSASAERVKQAKHRRKDGLVLDRSWKPQVEGVAKDVYLRAFCSELMPQKLVQWCMHLIKKNLHSQYVAAPEFGWSDSAKMDEIKQEGGIVVIAFIAVDLKDEDSLIVDKDFINKPNLSMNKNDYNFKKELDSNSIFFKPIAFLSVQFVEEDTEEDNTSLEMLDARSDAEDISYNGDMLKSDDDDSDYEDEDGPKVAVAYCFEIQIIAEYRGMGLGRKLMNILINIGKDNKMDKVMLTVFKKNTNAIQFYRKLGFKPDCISPELHVDKRRAARISYIILSLPLI